MLTCQLRRLRGGRGDLPGSRGALACGPVTLRQVARVAPPRPGAAKLRRGSDCRVMLDAMRWPRLPARTLPRDKWCFFDGSFRLNHEAFQSRARDFDC